MPQHNGSARRDTGPDRTTDPTLVWLLERAGERWGAARVAAAAAALVRSGQDAPAHPRRATESTTWLKTYHPEKRRQYGS